MTDSGCSEHTEQDPRKGKATGKHPDPGHITVQPEKIKDEGKTLNEAKGKTTLPTAEQISWT